MSYVLAIDVGTSFTAAAILRDDPNAPRVPESLPLGLRGTAVPSVVYYPEEGPILVGEAAERRGLDSPERVVREFKRRVGDEVPISVGSLQLPAEDVFAAMARWVAGRAEEREGAPPSGIVLSHPASWGAHRTQVILGALAAKDLANVTLISEPEAAALHYAAQVRVEDGSTIAVYDLGGGTFDTAVLKKTDAGHFELLGRPEGIEGLGGADFDAAVLRHVAEHAGEGLAGLDPSEPGVLAALARLRRECVEAKEALSADSEASISVLLPGVQQQVRLVRSEFEAMISEPIRETVEALEHSLEELGLEPADLTAVLLIGGSSRIPLVAQLISEQLDRPIAVDADPKSSICLGAAVAALRGRQEAVGLLSEVAQPGAVVVLSEADGTQEAEAAAATRRASWSRKSGVAFGSLAGAPAGATANGHRGAHAPGAHPEKHSKRSTARLTAVATAAALLTVLTATAAQSPEGAAGLSAMFGASEAGAAPGSGSGEAPQSGGAAGGAAGAAGEAADPVKGIEASGKAPATSDGGAGIEVVASPTSQPPASAWAEAAPPPAGGTDLSGAAAGSTPAGETGATSDPAQVPVPGAVPAAPLTEPTAEPVVPAVEPLVEPSPAQTPPATEAPPPTDTSPPAETPPTTDAPQPADTAPATETPSPTETQPAETSTVEPPPPAESTDPTMTQSTASTSIPTESAG